MVPVERWEALQIFSRKVLGSWSTTIKKLIVLLHSWPNWPVLQHKQVIFKCGRTSVKRFTPPWIKCGLLCPESTKRVKFCWWWGGGWSSQTGRRFGRLVYEWNSRQKRISTLQASAGKITFAESTRDIGEGRVAKTSIEIFWNSGVYDVLIGREVSPLVITM